jgi:flagellar hook-length control protein FliK
LVVARIDSLKNILAGPPQQTAASYKSDLGRDADVFSELLPTDKSYQLPRPNHPDFLGPPVHIYDDSYQSPPIIRQPHPRDRRFLGPPIHVTDDHLSPGDLGPPPRDLNDDQPQPADRVDAGPAKSDLSPPPHADGVMTPDDIALTKGSSSKLGIPASPDGIMTLKDASADNGDQKIAADPAAALIAALIAPQLDAGGQPAAPPIADATAALLPATSTPLAANLQSPLLSLAVATTEGVVPTTTALDAGSIAAPAAVLAHAPAQALTAPGPALLQADMLPDAAPPSDAAQTASQDQEPPADPATALVAKLGLEKKTDASLKAQAWVSNENPQAQASVQANEGEQSAAPQPQNNAEVSAASETKLAVDKTDKAAVKTDNAAAFNVQLAKADAPVLTQPHQPGTQALHAQPSANIHLSPVADIQQNMARAAVALARVPFEIAVSAHKGEKEFEIRLDPPELGRVDVSMSVDKNGKVATHLFVERSATLDQLRKDAPNLERALQNSGLKTDSGSLQFSLRDQNTQNFAGSQGRDGSLRRGVLHAALIETTVLAQPYMASLGASRGRGIDLRV